MAISIPEVVLNSNSGCEIRMPVIGMGTAVQRIHFDPTSINLSIIEAIKQGYRHFDTAVPYKTESLLGEAIVEAVKVGLIYSRQELFITSKLWIADAHPDLVIPALHKSLQNLQLEHVDLYLIHWPISAKPGVPSFPINEEDILPMEFKSVWAAMEDCQRLGFSKSIGVCNFSCEKLKNLLKHATIPPSVNQVEMSPVWQQKKLREFCVENHIVVIAYGPLGAKGARWGTNQVMDCEVLQEIAKDRGKTVAQVSLRWVYEQGVALLVKSFNKERMRENLSIFDWALSEADYNKINKIEQHIGMPKSEIVSVIGPYKSLEELWDGEV